MEGGREGGREGEGREGGGGMDGEREGGRGVVLISGLSTLTLGGQCCT